MRSRSGYVAGRPRRDELAVEIRAHARPRHGNGLEPECADEPSEIRIGRREDVGREVQPVLPATLGPDPAARARRRPRRRRRRGPQMPRRGEPGDAGADDRHVARARYPLRGACLHQPVKTSRGIVMPTFQTPTSTTSWMWRSPDDAGQEVGVLRRETVLGDEPRNHAAHRFAGTLVQVGVDAHRPVVVARRGLGRRGNLERGASIERFCRVSLRLARMSHSIALTHTSPSPCDAVGVARREEGALAPDRQPERAALDEVAVVHVAAAFVWRERRERARRRRARRPSSR